MPGESMRWRAAAAPTKRIGGSADRCRKRRRCRPPRSSAAPMASAPGRAAWKSRRAAPRISRSKAAIAAWATIPQWSMRWPIAWRSPKATGRRSNAAAGAASSIPIHKVRLALRRVRIASPRKSGAREKQFIIGLTHHGLVGVGRCRSIAKTRYALRMAQPLARIIDQLKREPSRTGSIVITVFGDAIVPRGGSVWLGTLLAFFRDHRHRQRRSAHRDVAARGRRLARTQQGRPQQLTTGWSKKGRQTFDAATRHIYDPPPSDWTGRFELLLIGNGEDRDASRERLKNAGFGSPLPGVWIAPSGVPVPEEAAGAIRLEVSAEDDSGRRLLRESWPLDRTADAYLKFMKTFEPLRGWIGRRETPVGCRRLYGADPADPPLPPRGAARSAAADRAAAGGLAGPGRPRALRRNLSRTASSVGTMA